MLQVRTEVSGKATSGLGIKVSPVLLYVFSGHSHAGKPIASLSAKSSPFPVFQEKNPWKLSFLLCTHTQTPLYCTADFQQLFLRGQDSVRMQLILMCFIIVSTVGYALLQASLSLLKAKRALGPLPFFPTAFLFFLSFFAGMEQASYYCRSGLVQFLLAVTGLGPQPRSIPGDVGNALKIKSLKNSRGCKCHDVA